jgi:hypothetical protein
MFGNENHILRCLINKCKESFLIGLEFNQFQLTLLYLQFALICISTPLTKQKTSQTILKNNGVVQKKIFQNGSDK